MTRSAPLLLAILLAAACSDDGDGDGSAITDAAPGVDGLPAVIDGPPVVGEPAGLVGTTDAHNAVRAQVGVDPLTWDPELAAIAAAWAARCVDTMAPAGLIDHNPGRSNGYPTYVGENIYGSGGGASGTDAVALWAAEKASYDRPSNTCAAGRICGHYTQIVWRTTTKVGCAQNDCPGLQYGSSIVCNYAPGGNVGGQPPY